MTMEPSIVHFSVYLQLFGVGVDSFPLIQDIPHGPTLRTANQPQHFCPPTKALTKIYQPMRTACFRPVLATIPPPLQAPLMMIRLTC